MLAPTDLDHDSPLDRRPERPQSGTLVILETIFCDYESDPDVLADYFARFENTLRSVLAQDVPQDVQLLVTVYMSTDKGEWLRRTHEVIAAVSLPPRLAIRVHEYEHPEIGYPAGDPDRIDWVKSPNKHSPYREPLFAGAHDDADLQGYQRLLRVAIDDDDIWLPWQVANLCALADQARSSPEVTHSGVLALGPLDVLLGYVQQDEVVLDAVRLRRTLTGDKFYVIEAPESVDEIAPFSPWSIPEQMGMKERLRMERMGVGLYAASGYVPGFVYMRWGRNLSNQSKEFFLLDRFGQTSADDPSVVRDVSSNDVPRAAAGAWFGLVTAEFAVTAVRTPDGVRVESNFGDIATRDSQVSFYLLKGQERVGLRSYSREGGTFFDGAPERVKVRGFLREDGEITARVNSDEV